MPDVHIAYSQRGYCTKAGYRRLEQVLEDCRALYNAALQERRDAWRMNGVNVSWGGPEPLPDRDPRRVAGSGRGS